MKIRADIAELLRAGLPDRVIAEQLHCDAKTVSAARSALGLPRVKPGRKPAASLEDLFRARVEPADGGHLRWTGYVNPVTGCKGMRWGGSFHTATSVAFRIRTGREPVGRAQAVCGYQGCIEPTHVDDKPARDRTRTTFEAIFGDAL